MLGQRAHSCKTKPRHVPKDVGTAQPPASSNTVFSSAGPAIHWQLHQRPRSPQDGTMCRKERKQAIDHSVTCEPGRGAAQSKWLKWLSLKDKAAKHSWCDIPDLKNSWMSLAGAHGKYRFCNAVLMMTTLILKHPSAVCHPWTSNARMAIWLRSGRQASCAVRAALQYRTCFQAVLSCSDQLQMFLLPFSLYHSLPCDVDDQYLSH